MTEVVHGRRIRIIAALLGVIALSLVGWFAAREASASTKWLCKPGAKPNPCKGSLETTIFDDVGNSTVKGARNARKPKYDCFYVYPTVSEQPTTNADKTIDPQQTAIAAYQAARYSQRCRVYAPVYRQVTLAGIGDRNNLGRAAFELAYGDVLEAWRTYLKRFNDGRGVVLIGHSQGTGMLNELLSAEIEHKRAQRRKLISAILLGGNVTVRKGRDVGGTFNRTPLCRSGRQIGCVIAFSAFGSGPPEDALFGRTTGPYAAVPAGADPDDYEVACTNPGALAGGSAELETLTRSEPFPGTIGVGILIMYGGPPPIADTPWLVPRERYTGRCRYVGGTSALVLSTASGGTVLNPSPDPTWGLHLLDANVALGNLVDIVGKQGRRYLKRNG